MKNSHGSQNQANRYRRSHRAVASTLDGSVCLFNLETCDYFSLNETGSAIWNCVEKPLTIAEIATHIAEIYEVSHEECCKEIETWLEAAAAQGVIHVMS